MHITFSPDPLKFEISPLGTGGWWGGRISDDWNSFLFFSGSGGVSDKSRGGYCGNTHPFSEIKLPPSQEID